MCIKYRKYELIKEIKDKKIKKFNFSILQFVLIKYYGKYLIKFNKI